MTQQSNNLQVGHAVPAYPLTDLTRPLPSLVELQAFISAASLGSFSKAADHLCRTQGAVSRQIQQLEEHYRCALFTRHSTGLNLTPEGEALLPIVTHVLTTLVFHAENQHHMASVLSLRLPPTFATRWFMPRLQQIESALGGTTLRIVTYTGTTADFTAHHVDAIIMSGTGSWPGIQAVYLFEDMLTPLCSPELARALQTVDDLAHVNLLHPGATATERRWRAWLDGVGAKQLSTAKSITFDTLEMSLIAAENGHGVAIGDPRLARQRLQAGVLVTPFRELVPSGKSFYLLIPDARAAQAKILALANILQQLAQEDLLPSENAKSLCS